MAEDTEGFVSGLGSGVAEWPCWCERIPASPSSDSMGTCGLSL